jgi:hypothetical protein
LAILRWLEQKPRQKNERQKACPLNALSRPGMAFDIVPGKLTMTALAAGQGQVAVNRNHFSVLHLSVFNL